MSSLQTYNRFASLLFRVADSHARFSDVDAILAFVRELLEEHEKTDKKFAALSEDLSRLTTDNLLSRAQDIHEIQISPRRPEHPQPLAQVHVIEFKNTPVAPVTNVIKETPDPTVGSTETPPNTETTSSSEETTDAEEAEATEEAEETEEAEATEEAEETEVAEEAEAPEEAEETEVAEEADATEEAEETEVAEATEETEEAEATEEVEETEEAEDAEAAEEGEAEEETDEQPAPEDDEEEAVEEEAAPEVTYIYHELGKAKRKVLEHPETHELFEYVEDNTPGAYLGAKLIGGKVVKDQ